MKLDHEWFEWTQTHLGRSGIIAFLSKTKVSLILCIFSSSNDGSKWRLLYSLLHPTTRHLKRRRSCLPLHSVDTMMDWWHLTQGGSKVRRPCQSTIVGVACAELRHSNRNLRTAWFEKGDFKMGIKKNEGIIIGWMCTRFQHTFMFNQLLKRILHPMTPLMW